MASDDEEYSYNDEDDYEYDDMDDESYAGAGMDSSAVIAQHGEFDRVGCGVFGGAVVSGMEPLLDCRDAVLCSPYPVPVLARRQQEERSPIPSRWWIPPPNESMHFRDGRHYQSRSRRGHRLAEPLQLVQRQARGRVLCQPAGRLAEVWSLPAYPSQAVHRQEAHPQQEEGSSQDLFHLFG